MANVPLESGSAPPAARPAVSVVIPTYNGRRYLGVVLGGLARQSLPADRWEVVVVDNNSTVELLDTAEALAALAALAARGVPFRCVREPRQGSSFARAAGVRAAGGAAVCFLDDDNEPGPDYLAAGLAALADPTVGLLTSRVFPAYETPPSPAVRRREHLLAVNHRLGPRPVRWPAEGGMCPTITAGMWIGRSVFEAVFPPGRAEVFPGRIGNALVGGEDIEIGILVGRLGYDRLYVPDLELRHHIPARRVQPEYFARLIAGVVRCEESLKARYGRGGRGWSARAGGLAAAALGGWLPALARGDSLREYRFIVAAALARFRGPLPGADGSSAGAEARP